MLIHRTTSVHAITLRSLAMKDWWQFESQARVSIDICSLLDLLAILQKSLDRAIFLYIFIHKIRLSGVRTSISIVHIRKFY